MEDRFGATFSSGMRRTYTLIDPNFHFLPSCEPDPKAGKLSQPESNEFEDLLASRKAEPLLARRHLFGLEILSFSNRLLFSALLINICK